MYLSIIRPTCVYFLPVDIEMLFRQWAQDRYMPSLSAATFYDLMYEAEEEVS